jgi:hypothetical protein
MKGKLITYALVVGLLGTGVNWVKFLASSVSSTSTGSFTPRIGSGTGSTWSGGSHK